MNGLARYIILGVVVVLHIVVMLTMSITTRAQQQREDTSVMKLVDVREYEPPPEPEEPAAPDPPPEEPPPERPVVTDEPAEIVIETEEEIVPTPAPRQAPRVEYLPQHRISKPPGIPTDEVRSRVTYPTLANRQGIEGVVYLELSIDANGTIQEIKVLREPGYGLGDAAVAAFEGITVEPAEANGTPVAVRYRYPVRFVLK